MVRLWPCVLIASVSISVPLRAQTPEAPVEAAPVAESLLEKPPPIDPADDRLLRENEELRGRLDRLEAEVHGKEPAPPPRKEPFLRPALLVEADYRVFPSEAEGLTGFSIARFRPGLVLTPTPWFRGVATAEFAGEYPIILDAFMKLRAAEWVEFTLGYSKPPLFASFTYEPVQSLPFPDRAPVVNAFRIRRDVGADVHFTPHEIPLEAWLRIGNGSGSPLGNDSAVPAGYGSIDLVLGRAWAGADEDQRLFGLRLGAGALLESVSDRDGISGQTPFGFVYHRPVVVSGTRVVAEGHAVGYGGPLRLTVEGALAHESRSRDDDGDPATPRLTLDAAQSYGLTSELAWVVLGSPREVSRAPRARKDAEGGWTGGAVEVALRYDGLWLGRGAEDVNPGGSQGGAVSLKWWPVDFATATLFGYFTRYDVPPIEEPEESNSWGLMVRASFFWGLPGQLAD